MAANSTGTRPAARVLFIVPGGGRLVGDSEGGRPGEREDKFVEIAAAWKTEKGGYRFTLDMVPVELLGGSSVTFVVSPIDQPEPQQQPTNRGGRR